MATKVELAERILAALTELHEQPGLPRDTGSPFPILIPTGDGNSIAISRQIARDISAFGEIIYANEKGATSSLSFTDMDALVRHAFGATLATLDLTRDRAENRDALLNGIGSFLSERLTSARVDRIFVFGAWLIRDMRSAVQIGPVLIEPRAIWLERVRAERRISALTERRMQNRWAGRTLRSRMVSRDSMIERDLLDSIKDCPDVCSVEASGLGQNIAEQKAILAARLALTAVALLWVRPSKALEGMGLALDGGWLRRQHVVLGAEGRFGSAHRAVRMPGTTWVEQGWTWKENSWLADPAGEALGSFLAPAVPPRRPNLARAVMLSLWWFHEACRAETPLMATVKFAAVLDTLTQGGGAASIADLVQARLGKSRDDPLTRDGRKTWSVIKEIYGTARSQTIHGSNDRYGDDWTNTRDLAESLARVCLVESINWFHSNPDIDDLARLRMC